MGEGSNINKVQLKSTYLDVSSQDTQIYIGHNSTSAINFVDGHASRSSFLKMGLGTVSIGEGLGVDKTIIGTKIVDMKNVSTAKVGSLTIMDASVNKQYMSMKNGEVIIGNNKGSPSNVISVQDENADDRTSSGITITAVGGVNVSS